MHKGRGRLSSIDLLPDSADADVAWASEELDRRERLQKVILEEFNSRLADKGLAPISSSAFNRHSVKLARIGRRIRDTREITAVLTDRLEPGDTDKLTIVVAETIKTLVFEMLQEGGEAGFNPKQTKEMAEALRAATSAQKVSSERKTRLDAELEKKVGEAIEKVVSVTGLTAERAAEIRNQVLGVRK